jgi:hypothetical protein
MTEMEMGEPVRLRNTDFERRHYTGSRLFGPAPTRVPGHPFRLLRCPGPEAEEHVAGWQLVKQLRLPPSPGEGRGSPETRPDGLECDDGVEHSPPILCGVGRERGATGTGARFLHGLATPEPSPGDVDLQLRRGYRDPVGLDVEAQNDLGHLPNHGHLKRRLLDVSVPDKADCRTSHRDVAAVHLHANLGPGWPATGRNVQRGGRSAAGPRQPSSRLTLILVGVQHGQCG